MFTTPAFRLVPAYAFSRLGLLSHFHESDALFPRGGWTDITLVGFYGPLLFPFTSRTSTAETE